MLPSSKNILNKYEFLSHLTIFPDLIQALTKILPLPQNYQTFQLSFICFLNTSITFVAFNFALYHVVLYCPLNYFTSISVSLLSISSLMIGDNS